MREITLILLMSIITACASPQANLVGKNFDADSEYCRQLRKSATLLVQNNPGAHGLKTRATNPRLAIHNSIPQIRLDDARNAYHKDCESLSAFNLRQRRNSIW